MMFGLLLVGRYFMDKLAAALDPPKDGLAALLVPAF